MGSSNSGPSSWLKSLKGARPCSETDLHNMGVELAERQQVPNNNSSSQQQAQTVAIAPAPAPLPHNNTQEMHLSTCASSDLPSAFGTPPDNGRVSSLQYQVVQPVQQQPTDTQQQQQQQPPPPGPATGRSSKGSSASVRWLPGFEAPQPGAQPPGVAGAVAGAGKFASPNTAAGVTTKQQDLITANVSSAAQEAAEEQPGTVAVSSSSNSSRDAAAPAAWSLPASDDPQLDHYLHYLLHNHNHSHKFLHYPGWGISESGCAAIGAFLQRDKRIKIVSLSDNGITDDGVELIAEGLAHNGTVLSLDLSSNNITNVGAIDLAEALHSDKCKLLELRLANNRIGDEGADALAAALTKCSCKKLKLKLSGNPISAGQLEVVENCLKTREYKMSQVRPSGSKPATDKRHVRKCSSGLQFYIELTEGQQGGRTTSSNNLLQQRDVVRLPRALAVAALVEPKDTTESSIGMQAAHLLAELQGRKVVTPSESSLTTMLAIRLACRGYDVVLRTCFPDSEAAGMWQQQQAQQQDTAATNPGLLASGLRHTFLRVSQPADELSVEQPTLIVDPFFREQFELPHATPRLQEALDALPRVLCLAEQRLWHVVELLCTDTAAAFKEARLSLPPWRQTPAVMGMWLSAKCQDVVVDADSSSETLQAALDKAAAAGPPPAVPPSAT